VSAVAQALPPKLGILVASSFALGGTSWLKSSGFLVAFALFLSAWMISASCRWRRDRRRLLLDACCSGAAFLVAPVALALLNRRFGSPSVGLLQFGAVDWGSNGSRDWRLIPAALGAPGLTLWQASDVVRHYLFIGNRLGVSNAAAELLASGCGVGLLVASLSVGWRRFGETKIGALVLLSIIVAVVFLAASSIIGGYNLLLGDASRYLGPVGMLAELLLLDSLVSALTGKEGSPLRGRFSLRALPTVALVGCVFLGCTVFRAGRALAQLRRPSNVAELDSRLRIRIPAVTPPGPDALFQMLHNESSDKPIVTLLVMDHLPGPFPTWLGLNSRSTAPLYLDGAFGADMAPRGSWRSAIPLRIRLLALDGSETSAKVRALMGSVDCQTGWTDFVHVSDAVALATCDLE
jgi:hypothetical protein